MHDPETKGSADKPEDGREEREGDISLPFLASAASSNITPIKDRAAIQWANKLDHETECNEPGNRQQQVDGPVDEGPGEGEQPEESKQYRERGDNFGVDEAAFGPVVIALARYAAEVFACETGYDGCKGKLANAKQHAE